jgi:hypothetical protein
MPTYTFYNESEDYEYEEFMAMSELDEYKKNNPNIRQVFTPIAIAGDHIMGVGPKTDSGFNENMQRISAAHPGSPLASRYGGGETHARIKTRNVVDRYRKKNK